MTDKVIESIKVSEVPPNDEEEQEINEKRESLAILATLGTEKDYIGVQMSLGDVRRLEPKEVEKYYHRYRTSLGKQVSNGLMENMIKTSSRILSRFIPIDDSSALSDDISRDELVRRELSTMVGYLILKGGSFVALASALFHIANHINLSVGDVETPEHDLVDPPVVPKTDMVDKSVDT